MMSQVHSLKNENSVRELLATEELFCFIISPKAVLTKGQHLSKRAFQVLYKNLLFRYRAKFMNVIK